jgi:septal ring factor EnvC (AmiA/AmiB activator)
MNIQSYRTSAALVAAICVLAAADSDTRTVQAEFDRCSAVMERFERSLRRYEDAVGALKRSVAALRDEGGSFSREAAALENRLEYFRNRFERTRGQADKIRGDLKNVSGPACPSCIESSVNMYCRNAETMQNDIDEYLLKAADLQGRVETPAVAFGEKPSFGQRRSAVDSSYRSIAGCDDRAVATLRDQAALNIARADSLHSLKDAAAALKALDIAASLIGKAAARCVRK